MFNIRLIHRRATLYYILRSYAVCPLPLIPPLDSLWNQVPQKRPIHAHSDTHHATLLTSLHHYR